MGAATDIRRIRTSGYGDPKIDQLAVDVVEALTKALGLFDLPRQFDATYFEPFTVGGFAAEPGALLLVRCRDVDGLETPQQFETALSFVWLGNGSVRIDAIEGLTDGTKYRFTILPMKAVT